MELMESHLKSLFDAVENGNPAEAFLIVTNVNALISKEIDYNAAEPYIVATLGDTPYSLHNFIILTASKKNFMQSVKEVTEIIYVLITEFPKKVIHYVTKIIATCIAAQNVGDAKLKQKAQQIINNILIKRIPLSEDDQNKIFKKAISNIKFKETASIVVACSAETIGMLARYYSYVGCDELQTTLVKFLYQEVYSKKVSQPTITGLFACINNYMCCFDISEENIKLLHTCLLKYAEYKGSEKIRTAYRNALDCFAQHSSKFKKEIFENHKLWKTSLLPWLESNAEDFRAGIKALDAYNLQVALSLVNEEHNLMTKDLLQNFKDDISSRRFNGDRMDLSISALGYLAVPCKIHFGMTEVNNIFLYLIQQLEYLYMQDPDLCEKYLQNLPTYIKTISEYIEQMDEISFKHVKSLQRITVLLIKLFPKLLIRHQNIAADALIIIFYRIYCCRNFKLKYYLMDVIHQSVLWTCSHTLAVEVINEQQTTYKSFLPLWRSLMLLPNTGKFEKIGLNKKIRKHITQAMLKELVFTVISMIYKLNLNLQRKDDEMATSDLGNSFEATKQADFAMFVNITDFCVDLLESVDPTLFREYISLFNKQLITKSLEHPLVSGFYKMLAASLKLSHKMGYIKEVKTTENESLKYMVQFLRGVFLKIKYYKDDLQVACLQMFLAAPLEIIEAVNIESIDLFIAVFTIGRRILTIAELGLKTLTRWCDHLPKEQMRPLLVKILPHLDSFLRSQSGSGPENINLETRKTKKALKKRRILVEDEPELLKLKKQILAFLGRMDGDLCLEFVQHGGLAEVIWNKNMNLKVDLPYPENVMSLYLDKLMPRILDLAIYCSDRKKRFTACEVLHTAVLIFLGISKQISDETNMNKLLSRMCKVLLCLGCDADKDITNLFKPLCLQLMHWYSSSHCVEAQCQVVLDTLFEGISHPNDGNVRDFSGICIKEFVHWTIKQNPQDSKLEKNENILKIVENIRFFAKHPDSSKKLGAALIFNNIYVDIREKDILLKMYWLDILEIFVNSFYTDDSDQIDIIMDRLLRVLRERKHLLPTINVSHFLLKHCSSLNYGIRKKCMDLFTKLAPSEEFHLDSNEFQHHLIENSQFQTTSYEHIINWISSLACLIEGSIFSTKNHISYDTNKLIEYLNHYIVERCWDSDKFLAQKNPIALKNIQSNLEVLHNSIIKFASIDLNIIFNIEFCNFLIHEIMDNSTEDLFKLIVSFQPSQMVIFTEQLKLYIISSKTQSSYLQKTVLRGLIKLHCETGIDMGELYNLSEDIAELKSNLSDNLYVLEYYDLKLQYLGRNNFSIILDSLKDFEKVFDDHKEIEFGLYIFKKFQKTIINLLSKETLNDFLRNVVRHIKQDEVCKLLVEILKQGPKDFDCLLEFFEEYWNWLSENLDNVVMILSQYQSSYGVVNSATIANWVDDKFGMIKSIANTPEEIFSFVTQILQILGFISNDKSKICQRIQREIIESNPNSMQISLCTKQIVDAATMSNSVDLFMLALNFYIDYNLTWNLSLMYQEFTMSQILILNTIYKCVLSHPKAIEMCNVLKELIHISNNQDFQIFFSHIIKDILKELRITENYKKKTISFILIDAFFGKANEESINTLCKDCSLGNKKQFLFKIIEILLNVCKESVPIDETQMQIFRLYQCYAYKVAVTVICNTQTNIEFYNKLLNRLNEDGNDVLWCKLVNNNLNYNFELLVDEQIKTKSVAVNIQNKLIEEQPKITYIQSQNLFMSSLSQGISKYDFTNIDIRSQVNVKDKKKIELYDVPLNNHECMSTVCGLLMHILQQGLIPKDNKPPWILGFKSILLKESTPLNTKLFLAQAIFNVRDHLKPFSDDLIKPIINLIIAQNEINGFTHDMLIMILFWSPKFEDEDLSNLMNHLMKRAFNEHNEIFKRNLMFIQHLIELNSQFAVDYGLLLESLNTNSVHGIQLSHILLVNNIKPWGNTIQSFAKKLTDLLSNSKIKTCTKAAETVGLALKFTENYSADFKENKLPKFVQLVMKKMDDLLKNNINNFYHSLEAMAKHYPPICDEFLSIVISHLEASFGNIKIILMKILYARFHVLNDQQLCHINLNKLFDDSNIDVQMLTLEMVNKSVDVLSVTELTDILKKCVVFFSQKEAKCRNIIYDILIKVYRRYCDSNDDMCIELIDKAKDMLLSGFDETEPELQEQILNFWLSTEDMPNKFYKRFLHILQQLYKCSTEDIFMSYSLEILLKLMDKKMKNKIFSYALHKCDYKDMMFSSNWRSHSSLTPMYAVGEKSFVATAAPQFEATQRLSLASQRSSHLLIPDNDQTVETQEAVFKVPQFLTNYQKNKRFIKDKKEVNKMHAARETKNTRTKEWLRKDMSKRKEDEIKITRSYRIGDYPDIEITFEDLLIPLLTLSKNDTQISRLLFTNFFDFAVNTATKDSGEFMSKMNEAINKIFGDSDIYDSGLMSALLDISMKYESMCFHPNIITSVAQNSGLISMGCLILEEYLRRRAFDEPSAKRMRTESYINIEKMHWIRLAELYKDLENWDMVHSIFLNYLDCTGTNISAINAENNGFWSKAQQSYNLLLSEATNPDLKDFYYQSYFHCCSELGNWDSMLHNIREVVGTENCLNNLFNDKWNRDKLLPHYIKGNIRCSLKDGNLMKSFFQELEFCLKDIKTNGSYLISNYSDNLAFIGVLKNDPNFIKTYLDTYQQNFLEEWANLNPLYSTLRLKTIMQMRTAIDVQHFLEWYDQITTDNSQVKFNSLGKMWMESSLESMGSIVQAETRNIYWNQFIKMFKNKFGNLDGIDDLLFNLDINLINNCLKQSHLSIAKNHIKNHGSAVKNPSNKNYHLTNLMFSKCILLRAKTAEDEFKTLISAFRHIDIGLQSDQLDIALSASITLNNFTDEIVKMTSKKDYSLLAKYKINSQSDLIQYNLRTLHEKLVLCEDKNLHTSQMAEGFYKLANFNLNSTCNATAITFSIKSMVYGSKEGQLLFPNLLNKMDCKDTQHFIKECKNVPVWMFIPWIPQLLAFIGSPKTEAVGKLLVKLAETYPNALQYSYRLTKQSMDDLNTVSKALCDCLDNLLDNPLIDTLLESLKTLCPTSVVMRTALDKLRRAPNADVFKNEGDKIWQSLYGSSNVYEKRFKEYNKYKKSMQSIRDGAFNVEKINMKIDKLQTTISENDSTDLGYYSYWLKDFKAEENGEIEIPGQYKGEGRPLPEYHIKIAAFSGELKIMNSLRKPVVLSIIGSDTKEYKFLVKYDEDLRKDQRIQQIFKLMNSVLRQDNNQQNLNIVTYEVIPLTKDLGLIEWVEDTRVLGDIIMEGIKSQRSKFRYDDIRNSHRNWLESAGKKGNIFENALVKYDRIQAFSQMQTLSSKIPGNPLKISFDAMSVDAENLFALRESFIKSYTVMCLCNWLLGIGDRHLSNILISTKNGKAIGIDFDTAFGKAVHLQVAETVPFRLTPQLVKLFEPHKVNALKPTMVHALKFLREKREVLMSAVQVFIQEPTTDWLKSTNCDSKISFVERKFAGDNPSDIICDEILLRPNDSETVKSKYLEIVKGYAEYNVRATKASKNLSCEDQVECLLDHATDYNLLCRMYYGWDPWI